MPRGVRVLLTGVVSAGLLLAGAGAAFASDTDVSQNATQDGVSGQPASPAPSDGALGGGLPSTDAVTGALGGLGLGL